MGSARIRIGLLHDTASLPAWLGEVVRDPSIAEHVAWIRVRVPAPSRRSWPLRVFARFDALLFSGRIPVDALRPVSAPFDATIGVEEVADAGLALLIETFPNSSVTVDCDIPVWRLTMTETGSAPSQLHGIWEALENHPVSGARIEMQMPPRSGLPPVRLDTTWTTTVALSPLVNHSYLAWSAAEMLKRQLSRLIELGPELFLELDRLQIPTPECRRANLVHVMHLVAVYALRLVRAFITDRRYWEQWVLRVASWPDDGTPRLEHTLRIEPPPDEFWADPFLIKRGGQLYAFFEIFRMGRGIGHLAAGILTPDGSLSEVRDVLIRDYHLSYPHLIEDDGRLFMVPETKANRTIELYECIDFPGNWQFRANLMEGVRASDTSFLKHEGRWWMFTCIAAGHERSNQHLHIYSADSLLADKWTPHPCNPVLSDARGGRPGGAIFRRNGRLYRPSQNSSYYYGYGLIVFEIVKLTADEFVQVEAFSIAPSAIPHSRGIHSIAQCDGIALIDSLELSPLPGRNRVESTPTP